MRFHNRIKVRGDTGAIEENARSKIVGNVLLALKPETPSRYEKYA